MDALTLCRKIADIDGWSGVDTITNVGALSAVVDGKGGVIGKALLLDLIFKYRVDIVHGKTLSEAKIYDDPKDSPLASIYFYHGDSDYGRPILECIIQANDV